VRLAIAFGAGPHLLDNAAAGWTNRPELTSEELDMTAVLIERFAGTIRLPVSAWMDVMAAQVVVQRSGLEKAADVAMVIVAVLLVVLLAALAWLFLELRKAHLKLVDAAENLAQRLAPGVTNVNELAANLKEISEMAVRRATQVEETVVLANRRVRGAVDLAYRRVREVDAFLEVMQSEAESLFTSTAAGLVGFRRGARAIFGRRKRGRRFGRFAKAEYRRRARALDTENDDFWADEPRYPDRASDRDDPDADSGITRPGSGPSIRAHRTELREREHD
jgi:hypothetical protein